MSEQSKKHPVRGVSLMIVVIVLAVIAIVFYNAISEKRAADAVQGTPTAPVRSGAPLPGAGSGG